MKLVNHNDVNFFVFSHPFSISRFGLLLRLLAFSAVWLGGWFIYMSFQSDGHSAFVSFLFGWPQLPLMVGLYAVLERKLRIQKIYVFAISCAIAAASFYPLLLLTYFGWAEFVF